MADVLLPFKSDLPHFELQCDLDGITYGFELRWNERASNWFMTIKDTAGTVLLSELRLVVGIPLGKRTPDPRLPPGMIMLVDTAGTDKDPGLNDLGTRVQAIYFSVGV